MRRYRGLEKVCGYKNTQCATMCHRMFSMNCQLSESGPLSAERDGRRGQIRFHAKAQRRKGGGSAAMGEWGFTSLMIEEQEEREIWKTAMTQ